MLFVAAVTMIDVLLRWFANEPIVGDQRNHPDDVLGRDLGLHTGGDNTAGQSQDRSRRALFQSADACLARGVGRRVLVAVLRGACLADFRLRRNSGEGQEETAPRSFWAYPKRLSCIAWRSCLPVFRCLGPSGDHHQRDAPRLEPPARPVLPGPPPPLLAMAAATWFWVHNAVVISAWAQSHIGLTVTIVFILM